MSNSIVLFTDFGGRREGRNIIPQKSDVCVMIRKIDLMLEEAVFFNDFLKNYKFILKTALEAKRNKLSAKEVKREADSGREKSKQR